MLYNVTIMQRSVLKRGNKILFILSVICAAFLLVGCSSLVDSHTAKQEMMQSYMSGNNEAVEQVVAGKLQQPGWFNDSVINTGDELMWQLEAGSFYFHTGEYQKCIDHLSRAEKLIQEYDDRALISVRDTAAEAGAALVNLNVLPYRGFCRDRMALEIYKALSYLALGREDAFRAQLRRLRYQQKKIQDDYRDFFERENNAVKAARKKDSTAERAAKQSSPGRIAGHRRNKQFASDWRRMQKIAHRGYGNFLNPAAIFLSGLGSLRDGNFDNAGIDFKRFYEAMPRNELARKYYVTVLQKSERNIPRALRRVKAFDFPLERDCVYVLTATGRSMALKSVSIHIPVAASWAMGEFYESDFSGCTVDVDGRRYESMPLADMDAIMAQEYDELLPLLITRIVINTAIKEAVRYGGTAIAAQHDELLAVGVALGTSLYNELTNTADTRSWEMLPKEFGLTQFPMPENRKITVNLRGRQNAGTTITLPENCRSAIVFVSAPSAQNVRCHILPIQSQ